MPPVEEWETFPFDRELRPRPLAPPLESEAPRRGEGGGDCERCARSDDGYLWVDDHWRLWAPDDGTGLPMVALLETRAHVDFHELPPELAAELAPLLIRVQRAITGSARSATSTSAAGATAARTFTSGSSRGRRACRS